jgi:hypothetical protein
MFQGQITGISSSNNIKVSIWLLNRIKSSFTQCNFYFRGIKTAEDIDRQIRKLHFCIVIFYQSSQYKIINTNPQVLNLQSKLISTCRTKIQTKYL